MLKVELELILLQCLFSAAAAGKHQGFVLGFLLFIIVLEALFIQMRSGCVEELLFDDNLALVWFKTATRSLDRTSEVRRVESEFYEDENRD